MFLRVFLLMRAYHMFAALLTLVFDRRRFTRPWLAWLTLAGLVGESGWLARRLLRRGDYAHGPSAGVDVACVAAGLALCSAALPADEQFNAANWMFPVSLMSGVGAAAAFERRRDGFTATTALGGVYLAATSLGSKRRGPATVLGLAQYFECYAAGAILTRQVRRTATQIQRLRAEAVEVAQERGRNEARVLLHTELHTGALEALGAMRDHIMQGDAPSAATLARKEAARLRRALRGDINRPEVGLRSRLEGVIDRYVSSALRIEFVDDGEEPELSMAASDMVCDVLDALLGEAATLRELPASTTSVEGGGRIVVALGSDEGLELSMRDPAGHRPGAPHLTLALAATLSGAGGALTVESGRAGSSLFTLRVGG